MEIRQLRYFVAVVEQASFSEAAKRTFIAQSALSHQIRKLEAELDAKLLDRTSRGTILTEAGAVFLSYAVSILQQIDDAQLSVKHPINEPKGRVSFGLPPSVCNALAVPLLTAVKAEFPEIELELTEEATGRLTGQLRKGLLNVAVLFDDGELEGFHVEPLVEERLYLLCKATHKKKGYGPAVSLKQALEEPLLLASNKQGVRRIIEQAAMASHLKHPTVAADINSVSILRSAVLAGIGSTILPAMALKNELDTGLIYGCPIASPDLKRRVALCRVDNMPATIATEAVAQLTIRVAHALSENGTWIETSTHHST